MESSKDKKRNIIIMCAILFVILLIVVFLVIGGNKTYTVTFNDGYSTNEVEVKNNQTVEKPSNPEKEGYKFIGWYKDGIKFDFSTKIDKNVTLKAMFEKDSKKDDKKANGRIVKVYTHLKNVNYQSFQFQNIILLLILNMYRWCSNC